MNQAISIRDKDQPGPDTFPCHVQEVDAGTNHSTRALGAALLEWRKLLGPSGVLYKREAMKSYGENTAGVSRRIPLVLVPKSADDVAGLVTIAARHKLPLYPISTGRNWGYGCGLPVTHGCTVVDLSQLNKIVSMDPELGLVTVQPGVTQGMLSEYLIRNELPFMVPVTGAGPDASLMGNALERGYGLTPCADHFAAVTSLEAVLPNGQRYRSALADAGCETVDHAFKWGIGPYLDGLFTQGNLGIVTELTIALVRRPERVETFLFSVKREEDLEEAVEAVREILSTVGGITGSINLMNARRMLAMVDEYPHHCVPPGGVIPQAVVKKRAACNQITAWTGAGALYGTVKVVRSVRSMIRRRLRPFTTRLVFLTLNEVRVARKGASWIPFLRTSRLVKNFDRIEALLLNLSGYPSDFALPITYWKSGRRPVKGQAVNPSRDGSGLLWYAPLVAMKADRVRVYVKMVERICVEHGMEPLLTLTSLSNRCFDSTLPILFDKHNPEEAARAHACHDALFKAGKKEGFLPYRLGSHAMQQITDPDSPCWQLGSTIKQAVDPHGVIAPGRYALMPGLS